jgi:hypothetical protein
MRPVLLALSLVMLVGTLAAPAEARSCTSVYKGCKKTCTNAALGCFNGLCEGYRASCLKTGVWQGTNSRFEGLERK